MNKKTVCIYLFNGFTDWEISFVMPELLKSGKYELKTFSIDGKPVVSMGGLKITPDLSIHDVNIDAMAMLILPGGDAWDRKELKEIIPLVQKVYGGEKPVAAICGATVGLANAGLLNNINHTSNGLDYLKSVSQVYTGEKLYSDQRAVTDGEMITASGIAPVEFAREIFRKLKVFDDPTLEKWFQLFKNGIWVE